MGSGSQTDNALGAAGVALVRGPIDAAALLATVGDAAAGGNVVFVGTVRGLTAGRRTTSLTYDAHEPLALATLEALCREAIDRFGLAACRVRHRLGTVLPGEASVAIVASAPHRREAFAAAEWVMERIKCDVPIWKCEERPDGGREWAHPATTARPGGDA